MRNRIFIVSFLSLLPPVLFAQQKLTLRDAVSKALNQNYQIQIARNEAEIAHTQNSAGAAGMLPNVSLNANETPAVSNLKQELSNGTTIQQDNVFSNNMNANVSLGYTLFDGMKMFATRKRLRELEAMGHNRLKSQVQNTVSNVIQRYSYIASQQSYMKVVKQLLAVSEQRYSLTEIRMAAGLANNTDLYLARLDLDARKQSVISQEVIVRNAYTDLNILINLRPDSVYAIDEVIVTDNGLQKKQLDTAFSNNPELLIAENQVNITLQSQKEFQSARFPLLKLNAAYGYTVVQSQAGFTLLNQNYGPSAGISFGLPLYTGHINANNIAVAKLQYKNAALSQLQIQQNLQGAYEQSWQKYETILVQVSNDESSVKTAQQYLDLMQLRYQAGQSTVLDFREAQRSFEETNYRLINNRYLLKLAETDLLRLTGQLVK